MRLTWEIATNLDSAKQITTVTTEWIDSLINLCSWCCVSPLSPLDLSRIEQTPSRKPLGSTDFMNQMIDGCWWGSNNPETSALQSNSKVTYQALNRFQFSFWKYFVQKASGCSLQKNTSYIMFTAFFARASEGSLCPKSGPKLGSCPHRQCKKTRCVSSIGLLKTTASFLLNINYSLQSLRNEHL